MPFSSANLGTPKWSVAGLLFLEAILLLSPVGFRTAFSSELPHPVDSPTDEQEFSARITWRSQGKTSRAQLFVKGDRYRIEHMGGIRTDLGYASVTIVRLDEQKVWYVLSQQRLILSVPLTEEYLLPLTVKLEGERSRALIGDSMAAGRPAQLYEIVVNRHDQSESFYEWVDKEKGTLLRLMSRDRDWSIEYEHVVYSVQPAYYFETPLGYQKIEAQEFTPRSG